MVLTSEEISSILTHPDKAAETAQLIYISEEDLSIERRRNKDEFVFYKKGKILKDEKVLLRIKKLVIPPGWEDVRICRQENGHLQVVGKDVKNRKQYIYHPNWTRLRNQTKFYKIAAFGKLLPKIRAQVDEDLDLHGMPQRKVLALVIRLMEETHIRIGNDCYAKRNKSYGLSTLRSRHLKVSRGRMKFHFIGKKGKEHSVTVRNKKLVRLINKCEEIPGWQVFKYYNADGEKRSVDSGMINEYIQEISGDMYSAKDFRTWGATKIFFETLREIGYTEDEKQNKKNIINALDVTADALGNTRSVCKSSYVHPQVIELYQDGGIKAYFKKVDRKRSNKDFISHTEEVLLEMFRDFEIDPDKQPE